jgi:phosphopantothenoylcysteine decarboxylase/phosphopantothenate--cysteine ligase
MILVAPATADFIAKMALGLADDLASTVMLATDRPVLIAPAMNPVMWANAAVCRNVERLAADGIAMVGPMRGEMAESGEAGTGRMAEPLEIVAACERLLDTGPKPLAGRVALVTSGPTHEPIDPVRYIANRSSGRQGYALAEAARDLGARTILVSGPVSLAVPPGIEVLPVETAEEMLEATRAELPCDIAVFAAAVADWRVAGRHDHKLKKDGNATPPELKLTPNPDILKTVGHLKTNRPALVVGFAAETNNVIDNAGSKLTAKGADLIVANDVSASTGIMGGNHNRVHLVTAAGVEDWPRLDKREVARRLMRHFARLIAEKDPT